MKEINSMKYFKYKLKIQNELKNLISPIVDKYNLIESLVSRNNYLNNYEKCEKISELINFTKEKIDSKIINITHLNSNEFFDNTNNSKQIFDYIEILDNIPFFNVGIFLIPKGNYLPLHNHPNMLVISKVIWGSVQISSYDKQVKINNQLEKFNIFQVNEKSKVILNLNEISILTPDKNNIHEVIAYEDSAFFDIILPSYDHCQNRECEYFEMIKLKDFNENNLYMRKL